MNLLYPLTGKRQNIY